MFHVERYSGTMSRIRIRKNRQDLSLRNGTSMVPLIQLISYEATKQIVESIAAFLLLFLDRLGCHF